MRQIPNDEPFSKRALRWIVGIAVVSFGSALVMGAFGEDFVEPESAGSSTFSWSALGHRAAAELLQKEGVKILVRQDPRGAAGGPKTAVLLLEPDLEAMREQGTLLHHLVADARDAKAAVVLVAPKWREGAIEAGHLKDVSPVPLRDANDVITAMGDDDWIPNNPLFRDVAAGACEAPFGDVVVELPREAQLMKIRDASWEPILECDEGTLIAVHRASRTYLVSDPDLFANHALDDADHAEILLDLVKEEIGAEAVIFDEAVHGFRRRMTLMAELGRPPLLVATLHATFVLGLVLWAGMARFGKAQPLDAFHESGKQALIENTAQLLALGGHTSDSLARYYRDSLRAVGAHHQLSMELTEGQLVARLQTISDAKKLGLRLAQIHGQIPRASGDRALRLAKTIHHWRQEMTKR